ncbi:5'-adenylylsulfate reductase-like 4 [Juglans microcarpa x Juglans regia]|uniref:5'-adenylylsulfate reductase-like 4 n=1 Tax=Juglans microcarpa x Juglans regia TaxID=2249226 RepID=UPI001B7F4ED9|nr:5'-adenylylsulfate reductase-like 4 [Juglans microcarpa x Juglans regia]
MGMGGLGTGIVVALLLWVRFTCAAEPSRASSSSTLCPVESASDSILGFRLWNCPLHGDSGSPGLVAVTVGDEVSLQRALNMVHTKGHQYVAVLFYASWCPFSRTFWPSFSILSSLYPSIPHFAIEESTVRPSILSKYGVHGFPTLFLLNSTMRVRYLGSRTLSSLAAFYGDMTGIKTASLDQISIENVGCLSNHEKHDNTEQESCPFSWARSPEKLLRQETYLALATTFVLLRLLYFSFPTVLLCARYAWRRHIRNVRLGGLWEHPLAYLRRAIQLFNSLKEPCKRSNLQEGAMNAGAWASKSLATVSIGDAGNSRGLPGGECQ